LWTPPVASFESARVGRPWAFLFVTGVALSSTPTTKDRQRLAAGLVSQTINESHEIGDGNETPTTDGKRAKFSPVEQLLDHPRA
jgi:hypothetical protein